MVEPENRNLTARWRHGGPRQLSGRRSTDYNLYERDDDLVLSIEMPGFEPEDIELRWQDNRLTVAAEHEHERPTRSREYLRSFAVPLEVDEAEIKARYRTGILDVFLPAEAGQSIHGRRIPVKT